MTFEAGIITTVAGTGERGYTGDGGLATVARLSEPFMCAFDAAGNLYVAEAMNHCIPARLQGYRGHRDYRRNGGGRIFGRWRARDPGYVQPAHIRCRSTPTATFTLSTA